MMHGLEVITRIVVTALGFNSSKVAEMHEGQRAIKGRENQLAAAAKFSQTNPSMAINALTIRRSLPTKLRNAAIIKDGVYLAKKRQDLRAEGRFAVTESEMPGMPFV